MNLVNMLRGLLMISSIIFFVIGSATIIPQERKDFQPVCSDTTKGLDFWSSKMLSSCKNSCAFTYVNASRNFPTESNINVEQEIEVVTCETIPKSIECLINENSCLMLSSDEISALEHATRGQSNNDTWFKQRCGRITSSTSHIVVQKVNEIKNKHVTQESIDKIINKITCIGAMQNLKTIPSIKYGLASESEARKAYVQYLTKFHRGVKVDECGLCVDENQVYLGASPDGLVSCECCENGVLEIKCPYSICDKNPQTFAKCLPYITVTGDVYNVKQTHPYYTQIQTHMGVTKRNWADLFIYTKQGHINIRVPYNKNKYTEILSSSKNFFTAS